jgi:hypothetical protein
MAKVRHHATSGGGRSPEKKKKSHATSDRWPSRALAKVVKHAEALNVDVVFTELNHGGGAFSVLRDDWFVVQINSRLTSRARLNYLLHELGHASIYADGLTATRYTGWDDAVDLKERLALVDEEFEAWARGRKIAKTLGIVLDDSYEEAMTYAMMTYVRWCASHEQTPPHEHFWAKPPPPPAQTSVAEVQVKRTGT